MRVTLREIRLKSRPVGMPSLDNFELASRTLPCPEPGEVQVRNLWMTVDPYARGQMVDRESHPLSLSYQGSGLTDVAVSASSDWVLRGQLESYFFRLPRTLRMTPAARALPGLGVNVVHDVVVVWFAGNDYRIDATGHVVEFEQVTRLPRNVVISA
jgi:hypothetical protein